MEKSSTGKTRNLIRYSSKVSPKDDYRDRRRLEMKRRFGILQSRRSHLERELEAVKCSLLSLDQQMQNHDAFEQLTIQRPINPSF